SMFPESQHSVTRSLLANQLQAVISQLLLDGPAGRVLACEVLTNNERSQEWIRSAGDGHALYDILEDGGFYGMPTYDEAVVGAIKEQSVAVETGRPCARNGRELRGKVMASGIAV